MMIEVLARFDCAARFEQAEHAANGLGPASPPPCRGFKSMKMRWLRQYEDDQKQQRGSDPGPQSRGFEDDAPPTADVRRTEDDADKPTLLSRGPHQAEHGGGGGMQAPASGATSSSHAAAAAGTSIAVESAAADVAANQSAADPDGEAVPASEQEVTAAMASMLQAEDPDTAQLAIPDGPEATKTSDRLPAQEQRPAGAAPAAAVGGAAVSSPASVAAECGSDAPPGAVPATGSQDDAAPLLSASGPLGVADAAPQRVDAADTARPATAPTVDADVLVDRRLLAAAAQEVTASRGTSPAPDVPPRPSEGVADSGAHQGPARPAGAGAAAAPMLLPPPDAGDGSASDAWDSPDLPPHLAKLGFRMDAPAEQPSRRLRFSTDAAGGGPLANGHAPGAVLTSSLRITSVLRIPQFGAHDDIPSRFRLVLLAGCIAATC